MEPQSNVATILRAARQQISDPARWTQGYEAVDAEGEPVPKTDPSACAWCAFGAVMLIAPGDPGYAAVQFLCTFTRGRLTVYNDSHSHADVLALFDRAIAAAEQEAPHE